MSTNCSKIVSYTSNRSIFPANNSFALERKLALEKNRYTLRTSIFWCTINITIISIILYELSSSAISSCPSKLSYFNIFEYCLLFILTINICYYLFKIAILSFKSEQIPITVEQKKLLGISDSDPDFQIVHNTVTYSPTTPNQSFSQNASSLPSSSTPMNMSASSWCSNFSGNDSLNYSTSSPSWTFHKANDMNRSIYSPPPASSSPPPISNQTFSNLQYKDTSGIEFISDESDLNRYLKEFENSTSLDNLSNQSGQQTNLLSSFWNHPITKNAKEMSAFLKRCAYQLSVPSPVSVNTSSPKTKIDDNSSPTTSQNSSSLLLWHRMNVDIVTLTRWNENLRKWISQTILERLVREIDRINESFDKQCQSDMKIGCVGLDRLRKTAQIQNVVQFIPSLPTLIPFLEVTPNQEYLVKRIRELAKGGCMSEFKWNSGSSYNGREWDESLPTDSTIIMHLFAAYLDTQLMPLPNMPDTKPFSGRFYIKCKDKIPTQTPNSLFIQQVSEKPPHYRVIVGEAIYEMVKGYNNLFHTILFFLYMVNKKEHGMLGRVNLGRAGVNMLWIIDQTQ